MEIKGAAFMPEDYNILKSNIGFVPEQDCWTFSWESPFQPVPTPLAGAGAQAAVGSPSTWSRTVLTHSAAEQQAAFQLTTYLCFPISREVFFIPVAGLRLFSSFL